MHITGENTVDSYAWVQLFVFYAITGENTVHDYAWVHVLVL